MFPAASFITFFSYSIIKILFGVQYIGAVSTLQIYVWGGVGVSMGIVVGQYIIAKNLTKIGLLNTIWGAILNVVMNLILIPRIGIKGSAVATVVSYTVSTFGIFFYRKTRGHGILILKSIKNFK